VTLGSSRSSSVSELVVDGLNCLQRQDCAPSDAAPQTDGEVPGMPIQVLKRFGLLRSANSKVWVLDSP
jgi:hypothetical protein